MAFNLFLKLDDELHHQVAADARAAGRSFEEEIRKRLTEATVGVYRPLTPAEIVEAGALVNIIMDISTEHLGEVALKS